MAITPTRGTRMGVAWWYWNNSERSNSYCQLRTNKKPSCCWDGRPYCVYHTIYAKAVAHWFSNAIMPIHMNRGVRVRIRISVRVRVNPVQITARYSHSSRKINPNPNTEIGDCSAFMPNVVAMSTRVGPAKFCMVLLNRPSRKTPWWVQTSAVCLSYKPQYKTSQSHRRHAVTKARPYKVRSAKTVSY